MHLFHKTKFSQTKFAKTPALLLGILAALGFASPSHAQARSYVQAGSHVQEQGVALARSGTMLPALRAARPLGRLPGETPMHLALTLPLRNQTQLNDLLRRLYTPGDPMQGRFLTHAQFTAKFGPTQSDYDAVAAYARSQGLTITATHAGRTILDVAGPASTVESAFGVTLGRYQLKEGRIAFAASAAPRLPRSIAARLAGIAGLNNVGQMQPNFHLKPSGLGQVERPNLPVFGSGSSIGTGPNGGLSPNDIKFAYSLTDITQLYGGTIVGTTTGTGTGTGTGTTTPTLLDGTGQTVGLFELDGYLASDIALYVSTFTLPSVLNPTGTSAVPLLQNVLLDGAGGGIISAAGQGEVTLDIDMILALAPNVTNIYVYEGNQTTNPTAAADLFQRMADDTAADGTPLLKVISDSWMTPETSVDPAVRDSENVSFQKMAAQGQSMFAASGDLGAFDSYNSTTPTVLTQPAVDNPASQPFVTGVGGTTLQYNKPTVATTVGTVTKPATNGLYVAETVWKSGSLTSVGGPAGSGGGSSEIWTKPDYQTGLGASPLRRDVPDVALNADPKSGYDIFIGGNKATVGGTDAAAPLWAAFTALVNQQRALNGLTTTLGFANPTLYTIGRSTDYLTDFHDITTGDNLYYPAETGYDDATGFGSFIGDKLIAALSFNADQGTGTETLSGTVTNAGAVGLANVTITAVSVATGTVRATGVTDGSGAYSLTVPTGLTLNVTADPSTVTPTTGTDGTPIVYAGQTVTGITVTAGLPATQNFTLNLGHQYAAGLQMISAPFDFSGVGGDFATLFGLTTPLTSPNPRLIQWEPLLSSYVFYPTVPADTLRPGQGYWIKFPTATTLRFEGAAVPTTQAFRISLQPGWNQIGDPFEASAPLSGITVDALNGTTPAPLAASTATQPILYDYDPNAGQYNASTSMTAPFTTLEPYNGYWIYARQAAVLIVPPEDIPPPPTAPPGIP